MPMVGTLRADVTLQARSEGIDSRTMEKRRRPPGFCIIEQSSRRLRILRLLPESSERVNGLGCQSKMPHHGNAVIGQAPDNVENRASAFEFHRGCAAFLQQSAGTAYCLIRR